MTTLRKRWQAWLAETHGQQFELLRHFLGQQLASDLFSSAEQVQRLLVWVLVGLGAAGPVMTYAYRAKYGYLQSRTTPDLYLAAVRADRLFFIALSMVAAGLVTALQWQGLFPNVRDYFVFKPLPVRLYRVFIARFLVAFAIVVVVVLDLNLTTSLAFPLVSSGQWQVPSFGLRHIFAHALTTIAAGLFVFFALATLQGALLNLLPARLFERFSVLIQAFFATAFVAAALSVFDIPNWYETIASRPQWMWIFPPAWFLGLYETLLGGRDGYFLRLAAISMKALAAVVLIGVVTYVLSYHRHASQILEQGRRPARASRTAWLGTGLLRLLVPNSSERAVFAFSLQTLRRSRYHKLIASFCAGMALVLALSAAGPILVTHLRPGREWELWQIQSLLAVPLVLGAALVLSLCYIFQIPAELRANWIFRMAEGLQRRELLNAAESLLILCGLAPVLLASLPLEVAALGWPVALAHSALAAALLLLFIESRLVEWSKIPFACSYIPGRSNIWQSIGKCFALFVLLIPAVTFIESHLLHPALIGTMAVGLCIVYRRIRGIREARWGVSLLVFEDAKDTTLVTMQLAEPG